jgi:multiple sugar transport system permease protein
MSLVLSLGIAILLNQPIRMRSSLRTIFFLPSLVPLVALAILWQWIFNGQYGVLNYFLEKIMSPVGLHPPNWMGDPLWTKPALIMTGLWGIGGGMIIYLAALQEVPAHLYEAAEIDGASVMSKFWHVTLPMISPVIYFNLVMGIIGTLQVFAVPFVMFGRGPASSTYFFAMYIYDNAFRYLKMGYASALAWIMFLMIFLLTLLATRLSRRHIYYGAE